MQADKMVLKCGKTGQLFFTQQEATEHAEAFGAAYANFEEVSLQSKVWVDSVSGRPAYTEESMQKFKRGDPSSNWEEKTVAYLLELQKNKAAAIARKERFFGSVDQKKLTTMTEAKRIGRTRSAKGLHYTRDKGTVEAAEGWIAEHADDADIDKITEEWLDEVLGALPTASAGDGAAAAPAPEEPDERKPGDPNPPEIKEKINQDLLKEVMEMGFEEMKAEKALYLTDNQGVQFAINWLGDHGEDADIELPLKKPAVAPPPKPKMSKEEADEKARELQAKIRLKKKAEEEISEKDKERMRVESTKMMLESNEKLKEEERKRWIEQQKREKEEAARDRAVLKEQLRLDYVDRFGKEPPPEDENAEQEVKTKTSKEQMTFWLRKMQKQYKDTEPEKFKVCLKTLTIYIKNLHENPQEEKYKKIKVDGKAFQERVAHIEGVMDFLDVMGFENKGEVLQQRKGVPDGFLCGQALKFMDLMVSQL